MSFKTLALMIILLTGNWTCLLQRASPDKERDKALLQAVEKGDRQTVLDLLKQGAHVNAKGINDTALETAIFKQDVEMVRLLLDKGAEIRPGDLADAARGPQGDQQKAAITVGLLFRVRDSEGMTALLLACKGHYAQDDLVKLLLAKGADANGRDKDGNTALLLAAKAGAFQVIESLIRGGGDVHAKNKEGVDALRQVKESKESWALQENGPLVRAEIVRLLKSGGAKE